MIQRIQSLYCSLTILLSLIFLNGSFLTFIDKSGSVIKITFKGIIKVTGDQGFELIGKSLPFSVIIIVIPVLSLITILLYKNRKIQSWFAFTAIIMAVLLIIISIYYSYFEWSSIELSLLVGLKMIIPVLILICSILAYLGIRKDERIIKSYDRLR